MADEKAPAGAQNPSKPVGAEQPKAKPAEPAAESGVFGDGSTQEQQDALVKEAEEANAETKRLADAERDARSE